MSFMFQLLDKLSETGGAENIYFDWWSQNEDVDVESNDEIGDKNKMQQILLNLCYKVRKSGYRAIHALWGHNYIHMPCPYNATSPF